MKMFLKRVAAYFIDIIIVSLVTTILTSNSYINKDYNKYNKVYKDYMNFETLTDNLFLKIEQAYDDNEISDKELKNFESYKTYSNAFKSIKVNENVNKDGLSELKTSINNIYNEKLINYKYNISKLSITISIISILFTLLYFVIFQYYFNGQTIGKKIMKIRIISNDKKRLTIFNYFLRSLLLNEVVINTLNILFLLFLRKNSYIFYNEIIYIVTYVIEMIIIFMILFDKNHRGLQDYVANTKVIDIN